MSEDRSGYTPLEKGQTPQEAHTQTTKEYNRIDQKLKDGKPVVINDTHGHTTVHVLPATPKEKQTMVTYDKNGNEVSRVKP